MKLTDILTSSLVVASAALLAGCSTETAGQAESEGEAPVQMGNVFTGEGLPNPNPTVTTNWGQRPDGREWGTSASIKIDPTDGHLWTFERCGSGSAGAPGLNCDSNPVAPVYKFDRNTGAVLANFGAGVMVMPHGIHVDRGGNVWLTDYGLNAERTRGYQVHKFSPDGELLMSLGVAGRGGNGPGEFNQPSDVITAPDGSIFVSDGHSGQNMATAQAIEEGRADGMTARIMKFTPDGKFIKEWGRLGTLHGEFRTPHAMAFDSQGRLWVADRGNHRLEIFDQEGNYLESRYSYGRISGIFITPDDRVYAINSESRPFSHPNWANGVRIGRVDSDVIEAFLPPFPVDEHYQGAAGEGVAVDAEGNVYTAEGPPSLQFAGGTFTKYAVGGM